MDTSEKLFEQAQKVMPGGVNSPVRAYRAVGMTPRFIQSAKGAYITDVDGVQYIDYVGSWGPMILGHANSQVLRAVEQTMKNGLSFGAEYRDGSHGQLRHGGSHERGACRTRRNRKG